MIPNINWNNDIAEIKYQLLTKVLPINKELYHYLYEHIAIFKEYDTIYTNICSNDRV